MSDIAMSSVGIKAYRGMGMEGFIASWYSAIVSKSLEEYRVLARTIASQLEQRASVLDLAPGPGHFAIELAKLAPHRVTGLDISRSFVRMARERAREQAVDVDFQLGNAAAMPFDAECFDFILCRAAFKNFAQPLLALREMRRVLKPGGGALIIDLRRDVSAGSIRQAVAQMGLSRINALLTRWIFRCMLIRRAYTRNELERLLSQAGFAPGDTKFTESLTGMEIMLKK
jgi:ubiquinone/menaquinone biosynthesis C-methylase UbiE